jgi:hypothetical protein
MYWYERLLPVQGLLFNLLFAAAAVSLHLWGLPRALEAIDYRTLHRALGIGILIGLILEPFALRIKFRETLRDVHGGALGDRDADAGPRSLGMVFAWFIHLIVGAILLLLALQSLDFGPRSYPFLFVVAATLLVLREMYILGLIIVPPDRDRHTSGWRIVASDLMLLALAAVAYSAGRTVIMNRMKQMPDDWVGRIPDAAVAALLFGLLLLAMRFGFLVEEGVACRNRFVRFAVWLSVLVALAAALVPYYYRP